MKYQLIHKVFVSIDGTAESVMCDVIKLRLKRKDERRSGKGTPPQKEMDVDVFL